MTDAADVARVLAGDRDAFEGIVRRHGAAAIRLASQWVGSDEAPDVAQEAFVRAFRHLDSYDPARPFRPWLLRIVANAARQAVARRRRGGDLPGDLPEAADGNPGPEAVALERERWAGLRRAVAALPPAERSVLLLRYREDLTYKELAQALGWPMSLVKNRLSRARRRVAEALNDTGGTESAVREAATPSGCAPAGPEWEALR